MATRKSNPPASKKPKSNIQSTRGALQKAPVAATRQQKTVAPKMTTLKNGSVRVRHREFLDDILSSVAFVIDQSLPINPALPTSFPWLARIAENYEAYKFHSLKFEFENASSTTEKGRVFLAIEYDALDSDPTSKQQLLSYKGAVSSAPWQSCRVVLDNVGTKVLGSERFTRTGLVADSDLKTYDVGRLICAVQGQAAGNLALGELYVEYDVELITPQLETLIDSGKVLSGTNVSPAHPFGDAGTASVLGNVIGTVDTNTLHFLRTGEFLLDLYMNGTGLGSTPTMTTSGDVLKTQEANVHSPTTDVNETLWSVFVRSLPASLTFNTAVYTDVESVIARLSNYRYAYS